MMSGEAAAEEEEDSLAPTGEPSPAEKAGERIGRYQLIEQIGEGGCGVVYLAEQEEPVRRRVALKVIKLGMDTRAVIARFEAERQALALMDHPHIAKVLDAGATRSGRPFFVMELVDGIRITDYCDRKKLSIPQRLRLFIQVCQAIQHAHQKGIIHRDIKPSNILVTEREGVPAPKVIDFGIAKATSGQRLTDKTLYTAFEQFPGTPAYMSPEQAGRLDTDTRSDIYSLGVLLYELLTGQPPFDAGELQRLAMDQVLQAIREKEPICPSVRLTSLRPGDLAAVAQRRQAEAGRLARLVHGDLDWIVMKALEKDRTRRYETANGLAMDIQRYLNHEPVVARSPSQIYRLGKLIQRNTLAFVAVSALLASLIAGLGVSTWLVFKEREARRATRLEANKSQEVAQALKEMLQSARTSVALGSETTLLRDVLKNQPAVQADLLETIGMIHNEAGDPVHAEPVLREALRLGRAERGEASVLVARLFRELGQTVSALRRHSEAEGLSRSSVAICQKLFGNEHVEVCKSLTVLGMALGEARKFHDAEEVFEEALLMARKLRGSKDLEIADCLCELGGALRHQGKLGEAEMRLQEALMIQRERWGNDHAKVATTLDSLAGVFEDQGKYQQAEGLFREALATRSKLLPGGHPDVAKSRGGLAGVLQREGRYTEAEALGREALASARSFSSNDPPALEAGIVELAEILDDQPSKRAEAEALYREALESARQSGGSDAWTLEKRMVALAGYLGRRNEAAEAERLYRDALAIARKCGTADPPALEARIGSLADFLRYQHRYAEAEPLYREALASSGKGGPALILATPIEDLADCLRGRHELVQSEPLYREALAREGDLAASDASKRELRLKELVSVFQREGKLDLAEELLTRALSPAGRGGLQSVGLLSLRGRLRAGQGRWQEAAADLSKAVELCPDDYWTSFQLAPLLVETAKDQEYRRHREAMLDRFRGTRESALAERTARVCLLVPVTGADLMQAGKLADVAVNLDANEWSETVSGLAEYREGHYTMAVGSLRRALARPQIEGRCAASAYLVLALALNRLNQEDESRLAFDQGKVMINTRMPKSNFGEAFQDWLIARIFLREATDAMLRPVSPPASLANQH